MTTVDSGSLNNLINNIPHSTVDRKEKTVAATTDDVTSSIVTAHGDISKESHVDEIEPPLPYRELTSTSSVVHAKTTREYLDQLFSDKNHLRQSSAPFRHLTRLVDTEISRVVEHISSTLDSDATVPSRHNSDDVSAAGDGSNKVVLQEKILVPVEKYPRYNFVGRILGPRGMTAKQLEEETGCKIMVRGRGSCRTEPLHVLIHAEDQADKVEQKLKKAVERINHLLTPPPEGKDELKRKQLIELSIINGTYRPTTATKLALQAPRVSSSYSGNAGSPSSGPLAGFDSSIFSLLGGDSDNSRLHTSSYDLPPSSSSDRSSPHSPPASTRGSGTRPSLLDDNQAYLASLLAASNTNAFSGNSIFSDYYRQLVAMSLADPSLLSAYGMPPHDLLASLSLSGMGGVSSSAPPSSHIGVPPPAQYGERSGSAAGGHTYSGHHHIVGAMGIGAGTGGSTSLIPPANMHQYLAAAAMLSGVPSLNDNNNNHNNMDNNNHSYRDTIAARRRSPITHDGSGDAQVANVQALSVAPPTNPMGGAVKRV